MSLLKSPRWTTKPPSGSGINWSHPLAHELVYFALPGADARHEFIAGGKFKAYHSDWAYPTPLGLGVSNPTTALGIGYFPFSKQLRRIKGKFTLVVGAKPLAWNTWGFLFSLPWADGGFYNPYVRLSFHRVSGSSAMRLSLGISATLVECDSNTGVIDTTDPFSFYQVTRNGTSVNFYRNGIHYGTSSLSSAGDVDWSTETSVHLGASNGAPDGSTAALTCRAAISYVALWARELSQTELRQLYERPLDLVGAPRRLQLVSEPDRGSTSGSAALALSALGALLGWTNAGRTFLFTAAHWKSQSLRLELYWKSNSGTVYARLVNAANGRSVTGSEVKIHAGAFRRSRTDNLQLEDGKEYRVQFGKNGTAAGTWQSAHLIVT